MKSKVLIPVDTARNSITAEEYAIKLNWRMPLAVTLLNVLNTKRLQQHGISPDDQARIKSGMMKRAESVLVAAAEPFKKGEVDFETKIEEGPPAAVICQVAEQGGFDMIILPQSGFSELEEILGGSVVHNVLWKCKIPVLLVKHSEQQLEAQRNKLAESELLPR
ncbi:MAG: universal stress protein [Desulfarculaceae bacterium]|nr:universal stress protein [Desulfarculaceae bacterium]MCF8074222.1 universal stress protein [Desulfarculaceae bacterium]MCF8103019.1 universal stress protein [Desulfarculaceae bacterium]MCF8117150.1 universal stress protein [Desulfarculaceae bacterium]